MFLLCWQYRRCERLGPRPPLHTSCVKWKNVKSEEWLTDSMDRLILEERSDHVVAKHRTGRADRQELQRSEPCTLVVRRGLGEIRLA